MHLFKAGYPKLDLLVDEYLKEKKIIKKKLLL